MFRASVLTALCLGFFAVGTAQMPQGLQLQRLLDQAEASSSLTLHGSPFHAQLEISGSKKEPQYAGRLIIDWVSPQKYRIDARSSRFHEVQIVNGSQVQEEREGSFYPGWLHSFVDALLNPLFAKPLLLSRSASLRTWRRTSGSATQICIDRDDRPGGITDEMTWSGACVSADGVLLHAHDFRSWTDYSEQKDFNGKKIARKYSTSVGNYEEITAKLTSLVPLQDSEDRALLVTTPTPPSERIGFAFISTKAEEARLESAKPFDWPAVREGKTDGFMIVNALTDVTGQVQETSKHNSDNSELEEAGRQAALGYKFKPMLVDGVPVQMQMPLVLHFTSNLSDPYPVLRGGTLLKQIHGCDAKLIAQIPSTAIGTTTEVAIGVDGSLLTEHFGPEIDAGSPAVVIAATVNRLGLPGGLDTCKFEPFKKDGVVTQYRGDLVVLRSK